MNRNKILPLLAALILSGCILPPAKDPAPVLHHAATDEFALAGQASWPAANWWRQFGDTQLNTLIERALADSPSMAMAQARVAQAIAAAGTVKAEAGPSLDANGQVSRQLYSANYIYPAPLAGGYDTSGILELDFNYDFDFWGRNRSALRAALGQQAAAQADADAAAATLSAAVAQADFQWQALNARIAVNQAIASQRHALVELEASRVGAGIAAGENLHPLAADAAAPDQTLVQLETQRDQARYQLQSLVGGGALPTLTAAPLPAVADAIPADLPLHLLARRPDVAAARDRVQASLDQIDSARAAFYPDFNISAFLGFNSLAMGKLLSASSQEAGLTPAVTLPIFDAGRLRANLNGDRADAALAVAQYQNAVQGAIADVNDASVRLTGIERERLPLTQQIKARQRDTDSAARRAAAGIDDHRTALRDQVAVLTLQDQEVLRHAQALSAEVDLIKALGGGYGAPAASAARAELAPVSATATPQH